MYFKIWKNTLFHRMGLKNTFNFPVPPSCFHWRPTPGQSSVGTHRNTSVLAGLAILNPVHVGGKYPGPLPRCSWMTCKRGQSPRYLRPFRSSNNGKFPANAPLCPGRGGAGVYIDWCIRARFELARVRVMSLIGSRLSIVRAARRIFYSSLM